MSDDGTTGSQGASGSPPDEGHNGTVGPLGRKIVGVCTVVLAVTAVLGQALGVWKEVYGLFVPGEDGSAPSAADSVRSPTAGVSGRSESVPRCDASSSRQVLLALKGRPTRSEAHAVATVKCAVGPGDHLSWVVRKETGDPARPRVHYTLRYDLGRQGPGQYRYDADLGTTAPGSERTLIVVLMDDTTYRDVKATRDPETAYVDLPLPVPAVSNSLLVTTPG
ncbi:hypothetical protein [Streptomyces xinghaiensis]|uniref:hypothetical protein n=1 Tax=Streptomyces xinghaiensis TaxID=1038928 RepID=UPI002E15CD2D|nr:hypothetical protein OG463_03980 [Streptomyces xinghaiensis]